MINRAGKAGGGLLGLAVHLIWTSIPEGSTLGDV